MELMFWTLCANIEYMFYVGEVYFGLGLDDSGIFGV